MPDRRLMLHFVPRRPDPEFGELVDEAARGTGTTVLTRSPDCFVGDRSRFAAGIELRFEDREAADATAVVFEDRLGEAIDRAESVALIGDDLIFSAPESGPADASGVRYQYLMRRRRELTHEQYLHRYETIHSSFGLRTPHIEGYTQFHVDPDASADLAAAMGMTTPPVDSVSELHLRSVAHFIEGITARPEIGTEAREDEERFVDRARSHQFVNQIRTRNA